MIIFTSSTKPCKNKTALFRKSYAPAKTIKNSPGIIIIKFRRMSSWVGLLEEGACKRVFLQLGDAYIGVCCILFFISFINVSYIFTRVLHFIMPKNEKDYMKKYLKICNIFDSMSLIYGMLLKTFLKMANSPNNTGVKP